MLAAPRRGFVNGFLIEEAMLTLEYALLGKLTDRTCRHLSAVSILIEIFVIKAAVR
jgi:hypothetical protein